MTLFIPLCGNLQNIINIYCTEKKKIFLIKKKRVKIVKFYSLKVHHDQFFKKKLPESTLIVIHQPQQSCRDKSPTFSPTDHHNLDLLPFGIILKKVHIIHPISSEKSNANTSHEH